MSTFLPARRPILVATAVTTVLAGSLALGVPAQAAVPTSIASSGNAYGSTVRLGSLVQSGTTSLSPMCTDAGTFDQSNKAAALNLGAVGSIGAVTTKATTRTAGLAKTATTTSSTAATTLLGGLVRARAITSTSVSSHDARGYRTSGSTQISGLSIGGRSITATSKPNQVYSLAGVATVTVNAQSTDTRYGQHAVVTNAIVVRLLESNKLKLPTGTIVVGGTNASLHDPTHARAFGSAYGTRLGVGSVLSSGPTALVGLPCGGSAGTSLTNTTAGVALATTLKSGSVKSSVVSRESATGTTSSSQNELTGVSVLNGVVRIDSVTTKATATRPSRGSVGLATSSAGTKIVGLKINQKAVTVSSAENSKIDIAGVGTLWLNRTVRSGDLIQVFGALLVLNTKVGGQAAGTTVVVGSAVAGVA